MTDAATIEAPSGTDQNGWEWVILEVFGHRRHVGRAREEERFGTKMVRIDVPTYPPTRTLFDDAEAVPEATITWHTHYYSGSAVFSFSLTDEATVREENTPYAPPHRVRLPAPERVDPNTVDDEPFEADGDEFTDAPGRDYDHG
jgi:hypothetical protein